MGAGRAIVVGGSIAGLCAARVLAKFFDRVTVIDRDTYPTGVADRAGVPQGRHVHALLARGLRDLDALFPGFERRMREAGAVAIDFGLDFAALRQFGWAPRVSIDLDLLFASRALIECTVRDLFRELPNVELVEGARVTGLTVPDRGARRVTGVRVTGTGTDHLEADLVVDASGRGSDAPEWLRAIGFEPPSETTVDALAGYSTRWYAAPDPARWPHERWWKGIWIDPRIPEETRAAVMFPVEGNRFIVTLGGLGGNYPPSDEAGFEAELWKLRSPILAEAVSLAKPISPVYGNRTMANRLRHYERWSESLPGFIAVADAVCAFNPVYGQGMTAAALCARVLESCIERHDATAPDFSRSFFRAQARAERDLWGIATGADLMLPQTIGKRPLASWVTVPYLWELLQAAMDDMVLVRRFIEVVNLMRPASSLFAPPVMARVAVGAVRRRANGSSSRAVPDRPPVSAASLSPSPT